VTARLPAPASGATLTPDHSHPERGLHDARRDRRSIHPPPRVLARGRRCQPGLRARQGRHRLQPDVRRRRRPAIDKSYEKLFQVYENWTIDKNDLLVDGLRVVQVYEGHSTHIGEVFGVAPTGKSITTRGVFLFELNEQGLIVTERHFYDFSAMLIQIGVLRPKTG
jgi:predicted ester cyclase